MREALRTEGEVPTFLALHEFQGDVLPDEELARTGETPWSKKVMGGLTRSEIGAYRLFGSWGDDKAKF